MMMKTTNNLKPNIVLILADDMGYGDLSCYGSKKIRTPNMDAVAAEGIQFMDAHSSSAVCTPSRYSILNGRYCWRSKLKRGVLGGFGQPLIDPDRHTLPGILKQAGYQTAMFGKWHLGLQWHHKDGSVLAEKTLDGWNEGDGWNQSGMDVDYSRPLEGGPVDHGFDYWFGISGSLDMPPYCFIENRQTVGIPDREKSYYAPQQRPGLMTPDWEDDKVDLTFTEKAVDYIREQGQKNAHEPFFLYMAPSAPHRPCLPPEFMRGKSEAGKRGDMVALLDWTVGQLTAALKETGQYENTLFIVTSDNGARLTNFDGKDYGHKANGDLRGQKADIYEGGHREPLAIRWPRQIDPGQIRYDLISLMDIMATCADILNIPLPDETAEDSISFYPLLKNPKQPEIGQDAAIQPRGLRDSLIHHAYDGMYSVRKGEWKYIEGLGSGGFSEPRRYTAKDGDAAGQLYNIADDSRETLNLWLTRQDKVEELKTILRSSGV